MQRSETVLHWSGWRRWHQAWAKYYHYRRRAERDPDSAGQASESVSVTGPAKAAGKESQLEIVWGRLEPLLPPTHRTGRPYAHSRRLVLEAIIYLMEADCGWQHLPDQFPPWKTVYSQLTQWRTTGIWDLIWLGLHQPRLEPNLQL